MTAVKIGPFNKCSNLTIGRTDLTRTLLVKTQTMRKLSRISKINLI